MTKLTANQKLASKLMRKETAKLVRERRKALRDAAPELLDACRIALDAIGKEFLHQTGQFCRPEKDYPPPGTVHGSQHDAAVKLQAAIAKATQE